MEPMILAFSTRSSEVTLPLHMEKLRAMGDLRAHRLGGAAARLCAFNRDGAIAVFRARRHLPRRGLWRDADLVDAVRPS